MTLISRSNISRSNISMEDVMGAQREIEYCAYGLVKDINEVFNAKDVVRQFQWILYGQSETARGQIRLRMTDDSEFVRTIKFKANADTNDGKNELNKPSDAEEFAYFTEIAQSGMYKDRFIFPIEGTDLKWEVDCFIQADGSYAPWVKFDLEYKDKSDIPSDLKFPISISKILLASKEADKEDLANVYKEFITVAPGTHPDAFKTIPIKELKSKLTA